MSIQARRLSAIVFIKKSIKLSWNILMAKINKKQIALIHVAKAKLRLDDLDYRDALRNICGVESSIDLTLIKFERLMRFFKSVGFQSTNHRWVNMTRAQEYRIKELETALGWSLNRRRLEGFCKKILNLEIEEINKREAGYLIAAMERTLRFQIKKRDANQA
jgi:hypothetical protein